MEPALPVDDTAPVPERPLAEKLAFLGDAAAYGPDAAPVVARETHMSWVFLTPDRVYKLKKPVSASYLDYRTLERRGMMCEEEVRLNRRLAAWVYEGVAALVEARGGGLLLCPVGTRRVGRVAEWLVQMRRLPDALMLDGAIARHQVGEADALRAARHLAAFFSQAPATDHEGARLLERLRDGLQQTVDVATVAGLAPARVMPVVKRLGAFLDTHRELFEARIAAGRMVEGHGDLRPEHVFLGEPPAVIDCIEFSRNLRLVDPVEELAFLGMECQRLGAGHWGELFLQTYFECSGDAAPPALVRFYMSHRACVRARLSLEHLHDPRRRPYWRRKAHDYLRIARQLAATL